jgi:hypothetical protein
MDRFELRRQDYSLDEEQEAVQEAFRNFFVSECPSSLVRRAEPIGFEERDVDEPARSAGRRWSDAG